MLFETDGYEDDNTISACEVAKRYLKERIAGAIYYRLLDDIQKFEKCENYEKEELVSLVDDFESFGIHDDIKNVYNKCLNESILHSKSGYQDIILYHKELPTRLLNLCKFLPC